MIQYEIYTFFALEQGFSVPLQRKIGLNKKAEQDSA
jgi:hypothetical protein